MVISYGYHHLVPIDIDTNKTYLKEIGGFEDEEKPRTQRTSKT